MADSIAMDEESPFVRPEIEDEGDFEDIFLRTDHFSTESAVDYFEVFDGKSGKSPTLTMILYLTN
jgi:hypothetical protein